MIGTVNATLSIGTSPFLVNNTQVGTQLNMVLMDVHTQQPIPDVTLDISGFKGQTPVFAHIFKSDSGNFILNFYPATLGQTTFNEKGGILSSLFGQDSGTYDVKGPVFKNGGLYRFKIEVMTMGAYDNQVSKSYDAGISIPEYYNLTINDPQYGKNQVQIIAYYDQLHDVRYDQATKFINFTMPFDWSQKNIGQLTVVHQEIRIPRTLGDLLATKYDAYVNNLKIPDKLISIDDYSLTSYRIVHLILYRSDVQTLLSEQNNPGNVMDFALHPSNETRFPIVQFTKNAQYKVDLSWYPAVILPGATERFNFRVVDPFTVNSTVPPIPYDFSVLSGGNRIIYHKTGRTAESPSGNNLSVDFPSNYTGPITIAFENLNGSSFASTEFQTTVSLPPAAGSSPRQVAGSAVPEFPGGSLVALTGLAILAIILSQFQTIRTCRCNS